VSDLNISLLPWQQEVWEDDTRFKIVAGWSDGADYRFLKGKNLSAGDIVEFGGDGKYLILTEGETIDIQCSSVNATFIISYELYIAPASNIVL